MIIFSINGNQIPRYVLSYCQFTSNPQSRTSSKNNADRKKKRSEKESCDKVEWPPHIFHVFCSVISRFPFCCPFSSSPHSVTRSSFNGTGLVGNIFLIIALLLFSCFSHLFSILPPSRGKPEAGCQS